MSSQTEYKILDLIEKIRVQREDLGMACEIMLRQVILYHKNNNPEKSINNLFHNIQCKLKAELQKDVYESLKSDMDSIKTLILNERYQKPHKSIFTRPNNHPHKNLQDRSANRTPK